MTYNVLFVITDQHLADCVGYEGHAQAKTPHLDRLAGSGVRFRHAYTPNPICTPTRVSLLSGQYPHNHGYFGLGGPTPTHLPSFLGHFREHGYRTGAIGKLHLPNDPIPWLRDDCDVYHEMMDADWGGYRTYLAERGLLDKADHASVPGWPGGQQHDARCSELAFEDSAEGWAVDRAIDFMRDAGDTPWCMHLSMFRPHQCYTPAREFWEQYPEDLELPPGVFDEHAHRPPHFRATRKLGLQDPGHTEPLTPEDRYRRVWRGYLGCISHCDHALGVMLDELERSGQADRTVVVYLSDHGAYSGMFGLREKAPGICSESVCRVPYVWRVPGDNPANVESQELVESLDTAPTLLSLCGLPPMPTADGHDLSGFLRGTSGPLRDVAVTEHPWSKSVRWERWRLVHYHRATFDSEHGDVGELYDIHADPLETNNLYDDPAHREVVSEGRRRLLDWVAGTTRVRSWLEPDGKGSAIPNELDVDGKCRVERGPNNRVEHEGVNYL